MATVPMQFIHQGSSKTMTISAITLYGLGVAACFLFSGTLSSNVAPCPIGWVSYQKEVPNTCLYVSDVTTNTLMKAHEKCVEMNASLIVIESDDKMQFFKDIVQRYLSSNTKIWIGQKYSQHRVVWLTKDGDKETGYLPSGMQFNNWRTRYRSYYTDGLIYMSNSLHRSDNVYNGRDARFICEKRPSCNKGWYGLGCDKQCHCYGQECSVDALEISCNHGCQVGWTGKGCTQRKEDADVRYFCVNSPDQGKYASIRINTKGTVYENIHALDEDNDVLSWCNNTLVHTDQLLSTVIIKIHVDNSTDQAIQDGSCAGKIGEGGKYEWKIKIQEMNGVVSRYDKEVFIECDFSEGDTMQLFGDTEIKRERWFKRADIKKPVEYLKEKKEKVELFVVDPSTGNKMTETQIGGPVILRINFGVGEGDMATGVQPYNCYASSADGEQRAMFLDGEGCPLEGFPISDFTRNGTTKSLITEPFPLFGFDGNEDVDFRCSYTLCFGTDPCRISCENNKDGTERNATSTRNKRSARNMPQIIRGTVCVVMTQE